MQLVDIDIRNLYSFTVVYLIRLKLNRKNTGNLVTFFKFFTGSLDWFFFNAIKDTVEREVNNNIVLALQSTNLI